MTPFGRAMYELNIDMFCANSSSAKGRVEHAHLTLQDRLVKELRLRSISTVAQANAYAPSFIAAAFRACAAAEQRTRFGEMFLSCSWRDKICFSLDVRKYKLHETFG
jgi:hypothetical protein